MAEASVHGRGMHENLLEQIDHNRQSRELGDSYQSHREHLTSLILKNCPIEGRVAVLGAGNCNDLNLQQLAQHCSLIELIDLDESALDHAVLLIYVCN